MKQNKIILFSATALLIMALLFMMYDLFFPDKERKNIYKYDIEKLKAVDSSKLCFTEIQQIKIDFDGLHAIAINNEDELFVAGNKKMAIYSAQGEKISDFSLSGEAYAIAVNSDNEIFVAYRKRIEVLDKTGEIKKSFPELQKSSYFTSIVIDTDFFFVADAGNKLVYKIDFEGNILQEIGKKSTDFKGFFIPSPYFDILKGREGQLWAINTGMHEFTAFNGEGELFSSWKKTSMQLDGFSGCCNPSHVAMLSNGDFVTSEKGIERVKIHSATGEFQCLIAGSNKFVKGTKGLDLAVNSKDEIYILDPTKKVVLVYKK